MLTQPLLRASFMRARLRRCVYGDAGRIDSNWEMSIMFESFDYAGTGEGIVSQPNQYNTQISK